jgi:probable addiction module antidote protein
MTGFSKFNASDFIDSDEVIAEYLSVALESDDPELFIAALNDVAKVRGIASIAAASGLGRESLYKSLRSGSKLRYQTVKKVLAALGVRLAVEAIRPSESAGAA